MKSNKKILTSIDLSRNDIYNVSQIVGSEYSTSPMGQDLIVQTLGGGNTYVKSDNGKVQILSGSTSWADGKIIDNTTKRNNLSSGVEVSGTGITIANGSTSGSIIADAPNVALRASSTTDAEKTSIKLSSTNDSVAVKGAIISEIATTSETVDAPTIKIGSTNTTNLNITSSTTLGFNIIAKADTTYTNANGISRTCDSLVQTKNVFADVVDVNTVDVSTDFKVSHGDAFQGIPNATFRTASYKLESTEINIDAHETTTATPKLKLYTGNADGNNYQYGGKNSKAAKNSKGYLIINDITSNVELDAQVVDIHDNFDINLPASKHADIRTPYMLGDIGILAVQAGGEYYFAENHSSTIQNPSLQIIANGDNSSITVNDLSANNKATVDGETHSTEIDPALKVIGAATITKDVFLNGNLNFDSSTGKILNTHANKIVEIETDNIKLTGSDVKIVGSTKADISTSGTLNIANIGASISTSIKAGTSVTDPILEIAANTTTSSIRIGKVDAKDIVATRGGTFAFNGVSYSTSVNGLTSIYSTSLSLTGLNTFKASSTANNFDIDAGSTTGQSKVKATNLEAVSNITAASSTVTGDASFGGNITVAGDVQLSGNGLIKSTSSVKNIQIQGEHLVDIRTAGAGSTATSIIYADTSTTYINGSNIKASNSLTVDNIATVDTTHAAFQVPTEITRKLTVSYSGNDAMSVAGNVSMNSGTINSTTINGSTVSIQPVNTVIGSNTKDVSIAGKNNLTIMSNQSTSASYIRATNMRADSTLSVNNFNIYYDTTTSSLVFAQGV